MINTKIRLVAFTQDCENYGTAEQPSWKFKGGVEVLVSILTMDEAVKGHDFLKGLINKATPLINSKSDLFEREVMDWGLFQVGEYTPDERDQLDFEDRILYPPYTIAELSA